MTTGWRRWMRIFRRDPLADVDAELRFHLDARVEDLIARGAAPEVAREQALEEFGDVEVARKRLGVIDRRIADRHRRAEWWEGIAQDIRHTLRGLARSPAFTVMVVVTLALGIGANAAVFSLVDRLFLAAPAGVVRPEQVRRILGEAKFAGAPAPQTLSVFNYPQFRSIARTMPRGVAVAGFVPTPQPYGPTADAPQRPVEFSVGNYLGLLGLKPVVGRFFSPSELDVTGFTPVAVISQRLWQRDFHGTNDVLGRPLNLGTHRYTIIGVVPDGFAGLGLDHVDIWLPFNCWPSWVSRRANWYEQTGTLMIRPVVRMSSASVEPAVLAAATRGLRTDGVPWDSASSAMVMPLRGAGSPEFLARQNAVAKRLAVVAAIILLIACANVTNLALNRAMARRHETAIRLALGVSRWRLVVHAMSESVIVALVAGAVSGVAATWGALVLGGILVPHTTWGGVWFNPSLAWFVGALSLAVGVAVGLVPALRGSRPGVIASLKGEARGAGRDRGRLRSGLVIVQAALTLVLLAGAGLFVRSLQRVQAIDLGYDVHNIVFVSPRAGEDTAAARAMQSNLPRLAERLAAVPGVERTALMFMPPMWGLSWIDTYLPDRDSLPGASRQGPPMVLLGSPGFLQALGVQIVAGRGFSPGDRAGAEPVLVVNRALARAYWPGQEAVGKCLILEKRSDVCRRIVGVVADAHMHSIIEEPGPAFFVPIGQAPEMRTPGSIVIRTAPGRRAAVQAAMASVVRDVLGPGVRTGIQSMGDLLAPQFRQWRAGATLFSIAGLLALLVAVVGIYSTVSYGIAQRTRELGIRMALGARSGQVARLVLVGGVRTVLVGVLLGVIAALLLGRLVASLLYGVAPWDPWVLSAAGVVLLAVAALACLVPARRAARLDPMETLRVE